MKKEKGIVLDDKVHLKVVMENDDLVFYITEKDNRKVVLRIVDHFKNHQAHFDRSKYDDKEDPQLCFTYTKKQE